MSRGTDNAALLTFAFLVLIIAIGALIRQQSTVELRDECSQLRCAPPAKPILIDGACLCIARATK